MNQFIKLAGTEGKVGGYFCRLPPLNENTALEYSMTLRLLTEHHLEFLRLKGGCTGSSESTLVKIPHCWKSHVVAHIILLRILYKNIPKK